MPKSYSLLSLIIIFSCSTDTSSHKEKVYHLGSVGAFAEMVDADVKRLALSPVMTSEQMDLFLPEAEEVANRNHVALYRESDLLVTDLFPSTVALNKEVLLIYKGSTIDQYLKLKEDKANLESKGQYVGKAREEIARRFGRLLSYPPARINQLLANNSSFRTMRDFGIDASNLFLYYKNLDAATDFYTNTLGFELLADYEMAKIVRLASDSYLILVDASKGMHTAEEPKTVAVALLTDQLSEWYNYLKSQNVKIKYDYKPKEGGAHDGFVAIDTEGYLLEFEMFKDHEENEKFIPFLKNCPVVTSSAKQNSTSGGLGIYSTITWLYYKDLTGMQKFYEETLGLEQVVDQGWAKIYKVSESGYVGLVDERRGMHSFTERKAVNVSFLVNDIDGWFSYVKERNAFALRSAEVSTGPESKYRAFVGFDPEGYYMEFDKFYLHPDNSGLNQDLELTKF